MRIPRDLFPWAPLTEECLVDPRLAAPAVNKLLEEHGRPEILLLDEVTSALDGSLALIVWDLLAQFVANGRAILAWQADMAGTTEQYTVPC